MQQQAMQDPQFQQLMSSPNFQQAMQDLEVLQSPLSFSRCAILHCRRLVT